MVKTLTEINEILRNSNNKVTYHWSRAPGQFLNKRTGQELPTLPEPVSIQEWYETINLMLRELNEEMDRLAFQPLSEEDRTGCAIYVSPEIRTIFEHLVTSRPNPDLQYSNDPNCYDLSGWVLGRKFYTSPYHPTNLVVMVPENPLSVVGVLKVRSLNILEELMNQKAPQAPVPAHNPLEATRLEDKEPVAKTSYKTTDEAWINPKVPMADKVLRIKFKKMSETSKIPTAMRDGDIGFDLYCDEDFAISSGQTVKVKTNIQLADMPTMDNDRNRIFLKVEGRSGLSAKGIFPTGGIIDPTYRGEIGVVLNCLNLVRGYDTGAYQAGTLSSFRKGDRIAQLVIYKVATMGEALMEETDKITETNRGSAGFGSSGV